MKKGMTIFALTTILCGAAAITENHNQAFARSGSHSSGHSASSGRSSHSSGHSASSGRSSHSSGHSASSGRSSHSGGHSASSGRSSHSGGHSASSGRNSSSKGHSAATGRNSSSKGHSATTGRNSSSKGHSATTGKNSGSKGHSAVVSNKSNSKGKNTKSNRNSKPSNVTPKGKSTNVKNGSHINKRTTTNLNTISSKHNKSNTAKNNKKSNTINNKGNVKGKATNNKNQSLVSKKVSNSKTNKVTKNNKKNSSKTNLVSKRNHNKKGIAVNPKKKPNLSPKVATKKYKTKEEISRLSTWAIIKYVYQHRNGSKINELHGCYCGPFFGDTKKGPKPVDILDRLCRQHDIGYEKKGYFNRQVNNEFIAGVYKYASKMKPAEREKAFYFAEGFKRMNNTPLQEVAKAFNLASKPFTTIANFISGGAKAIGNLFNSNKVSTINNNTSKNFDRGGSDGKNLYPWLKKTKVAR